MLCNSCKIYCFTQLFKLELLPKVYLSQFFWENLCKDRFMKLEILLNRIKQICLHFHSKFQLISRKIFKSYFQIIKIKVTLQYSGEKLKILPCMFVSTLDNNE